MARVTRKQKPDSEYGDLTKAAFSHNSNAVLETRGRKAGAIPVEEIQKLTFPLFAQGLSVAQVMAKVDRTPQTFQLWRSKYPGYASQVDHIRAKLNGEPTKDAGEFADFRKKYLGVDTFSHQFQWIDLLEGRDPRALHEKQVYRAGSSRKARILVNTPPNHGKALGLDTPILTTHGWATMASLRVGDAVFTPGGKPTPVVAKSPVWDTRTFSVLFDDGERIIANAEHEWAVTEKGKRDTQILTTQELADSDKHYWIAPQESLDFPCRVFDLDPYILGQWLGDGHTADGRFTTADEFVVEQFHAAGYAPRKYAQYSYETTGLYRELSSLGLIGRKYVPQGYLFASHGERLALIQGLMDSDGYASGRGGVHFTNTNWNLVEAVTFLARSFGFKPHVNSKTPTLNGKSCAQAWTVSWCPFDTPMFRLPRKLATQMKLATTTKQRRPVRRIVSITDAPGYPTQCITVADDSHMFLAGRGLIPTRNSTTITMDYVTYRICKDPSIRVLIMSASEAMAKKFLLGIKERLTHPKYADLIRDFGPDANGFQDPRVPWTGLQFYVAGRDPQEKDPTCEALGINGTIYGARADLIILDDCVTGKTTRTKGMREKTLGFIRKEVASRLEPDTGRLIIVGTRLASDDLYGEIIRQDENRGVWTYLTQPAILEYADDPADSVTLWPERFNGTHLNDILMEYADDVSDFNLVYQQESAPGDATFPEAAVRGCVRSDRGVGKIPEHVRPGGMAGLYVVGGVDPAAAGHTAFVIIGVDKRTRRRYLIDCLNIRGFKPHLLREKMIEWTRLYNVNEWRIEKNGLQTLLSQDQVLRTALIGLGARIHEHHTVEYGQTGKWDPDYGVASLAPLFLGALEDPPANLITIPHNGTHRATRELIDQLINWEPGTVGKTDLVMALWFADLGARKQLLVGQATHAENRWATRGRVRDRVVVNMQTYLDRSA